jgi:hypothetical protein
LPIGVYTIRWRFSVVARKKNRLVLYVAARKTFLLIREFVIVAVTMGDVLTEIVMETP